MWNLETGAVQDIGPSPVGSDQGARLNSMTLGSSDGTSSWSARYYWLRKEGTPDPGLLRFDLRSGTVRVLGPAPNRAFAISRGGDFGVGVYKSAASLGAQLSSSGSASRMARQRR